MPFYFIPLEAFATGRMLPIRELGISIFHKDNGYAGATTNSSSERSFNSARCVELNRTYTIQNDTGSAESFHDHDFTDIAKWFASGNGCGVADNKYLVTSIDLSSCPWECIKMCAVWAWHALIINGLTNQNNVPQPMETADITGTYLLMHTYSGSFSQMCYMVICPTKVCNQENNCVSSRK